MRVLPLASVVGVTLVLFVGTPAPVAAWGFDVHRFITGRAIDRLPDEIRPFFELHRTFLVEHSIDPDLWRTAGFEEEPPRHYLDLDAYGDYPFATLPQDFDEAVKRFGEARIVENGTLPWRTREIYESLVGSFRRSGQSNPGYAREDIKFFAAVLTHYVADALVPFHAVVNYDGQLTNQRGIHARFETALFGRFRGRLKIQVPSVPPIAAPVPYVFDVLRAGTRLVPRLLEADRRAREGRPGYDDVYFERFMGSARVILEARLGEAIGAVAAAVTGAWIEAGRPRLGPPAGAGPAGRH